MGQWQLPSSAHIMEVGPRDGLQMEATVVATADKLRLIEGLVDCGLREIEVASFVNPKAVPQMADSDELLRQLPRHPGVQYRGIWLNPRGLQRAIDCDRLDVEGLLAVTASETFVQRNTRRSIDDSFREMPQWFEAYGQAGVPVQTVLVMAAFGCNFEGQIASETVLGLIARTQALMAEHGQALHRIALADTMGWANPAQVHRMVSEIRHRWPDAVLKLHLHDTRGCAVANAVTALRLGVVEFDASIGGLGGCPFAGGKGATGNLCTEDLVFAFEEMGVATGIDLDRLVEVSRFAADLVGHSLPGKVAQGGTLTRFKAQR